MNLGWTILETTFHLFDLFIIDKHISKAKINKKRKKHKNFFHTGKQAEVYYDIQKSINLKQQ